MLIEPPKVSVGVPVYNGGRRLRATLDAILSQTFPDFELVISDNASTDDTEAICREYAHRDGRVIYRRNQQNVGAVGNYNAVFRLGRGQYFKWSSSNDLCTPTFLEKCVAVLDARPDVVLVYPRTRLFSGGVENAEDYEDGLDLQDADPCRRFRRLLLAMRLNNVMNGLIRADALRRTPLMGVFFASDVTLMAEMALHGKFAEIPEYLFYRRMDPESATKLKSEEEVVRHFNPTLKKWMLFQQWRVDLEYFAVVSRAPLSVGQKWSLYPFLVRRLIWNRWKLVNDLVAGARALARRWFGRGGSRTT